VKTHPPGRQFQSTAYSQEAAQVRKDSTNQDNGSRPLDCGSLFAMRRTQISVIIIALLATPLALLARGMACEASPVMLCCMVHGSHASPGQALVCCCGLNRHQVPNFGLLAPVAPTRTESLARLAQPERHYRDFWDEARFARSGFASAPFEPPRL
jgi:hypothetical protein